MHFKQDKSLIIAEVSRRAQTMIQTGLTNFYYSDSSNLSTIKTNLAVLIGNAVAEGVKVALDNLYTEDDFEKDLTLK